MSLRRPSVTSDPSADSTTFPNIFGLDLEEARHVSESHNPLNISVTELPTVVDLILANLEVKGIDGEVLVAADPYSTQVSKTKKVLTAGALPFAIEEQPEVLAGLLKLYLIELSHPLVPQPQYKDVIDIIKHKFKGNKDKSDGVESLKKIFGAIPAVNSAMCRRLLSLLRSVLASWWSNEDTNKALVQLFAPFFLRHDAKYSIPGDKELAVAVTSLGVFLSHQDQIFVHVGSGARRRMSLVQRGERLSMRTLSYTGQSLSVPANLTPIKEKEYSSVFLSPPSSADRKSIKKSRSSTEVTTSAPSSAMKAKRAKIKASDVLLIVEQEKMALMQQLDTLKESTGATISDLRDEISSLRDQVTEMRAILRTVMAKQRSQPSSPSKKSLLIEEQYTAEFVSSADEECDDSGSGSD